MNIALHGFEQTLVNAVSKRTSDRKSNIPGIVRYADDLVRHEARYMHDTKVSAARRGAASLSP
jgi:hypothetical protein